VSADEIRRLSRVIEMNYVDSENALDACHKRIKKLENRLKVEESRHLKELSQLQTVMDAKVADREETARRLVSAALILLMCLTASFAAFVGLN